MSESTTTASDKTVEQKKPIGAVTLYFFPDGTFDFTLDGKVNFNNIIGSLTIFQRMIIDNQMELMEEASQDGE